MAKREKPIQLMVNEEQKDIIQRAAEIRGTPVATWARVLLLEGAREVIIEYERAKASRAVAEVR